MDISTADEKIASAQTEDERNDALIERQNAIDLFLLRWLIGAPYFAPGLASSGLHNKLVGTSI